jgi:large subunit ribosomal protein L22
MKFSPKRKAEIVRKTVQNAVNLADIKYRIEPENLEIAECFVNKGQYLKRLRIMGRGAFSIRFSKVSVLILMLGIDDGRPLGCHAPPALALDSRAA